MISGPEQEWRKVSGRDVPSRAASSHEQGSLRKGKWTLMEEQYASKIIHYFNRGVLPISVGTTLRSYLSEKLNCDPMRITKKFAGASCIGKQVFAPHMTGKESEILLADAELEHLRGIFLERLRILGRDKDASYKFLQCAASPSFMTSASQHQKGETAAQKKYRKNANAQAHSDDGSDDSLNNDSNLHINGNGNGNTDNGVLSGTMDWFRSADSSESKPRRVMSVPNFHFEGNNDTVSAFNPVSGSGHANFTTETNTSKKSRVYDMTVRNNKRALKRSQSAMNINDMGDMREYDSFANDDFAASDLLLQFAFKVNEATRTEPPKQMVAPLAHVPHAPQSSIQSSIQSSHPQSSIQSSVQRHKKKRLSIDNTDNARSNGSNSGNSGNSRSGNKSGSLGPSPTSIAQDFMPDIHTTGVSVSTAPGSGLSTGYVESESLTRSYSPFTGNINEAVNARTGTNASNEITENTTTSPSSVSSQVVKQVVEEDRSASPGLDIDPGTDSSGSSSDTTSSSGRSGSENKKGKYLGFKKNVNMMHQTQNQTHQPTPMVLSRIK